MKRGEDWSRQEAELVITDEGEGNNQTDVRKQSLNDINSEWVDFFPYDEPYEDQVDGIQKYIDVLNNMDNMVMEGACGTGKTLIALASGIYHIRRKNKYSRVVAVTPVKQQLKQFIEEMETINNNFMGENIDTLILRGKTDILPYGYIDKKPVDNEDEIRDDINRIRDNARELIKFDSKIRLNWKEVDFKPSEYSIKGNWKNVDDEKKEDLTNEYRYNPERARAVIQILNKKKKENEEGLIVNGTESPYPDEIPHTDQVGKPAELLQGKFDPFLIGYYAGGIESVINKNKRKEGIVRTNTPITFDSIPNNIADNDRLLSVSVKHGVCPNLIMKELMEDAEVIVGNYTHLFDRKTRRLTSTDTDRDILNQRTICVVDEAHNIEKEMRDSLSNSCGMYQLETTREDIQTASGYLFRNKNKLSDTENKSELSNDDLLDAQEAAESVQENNEFDSIGSSNSDLVEKDYNIVCDFIEFLINKLEKKSEEYIKEKGIIERINTENNEKDEGLNEQELINRVRDKKISLENPKEDGIDYLTKEVEEKYDDNIWEMVRRVCREASDIISEVSYCDRVGMCSGTGYMVNKWRYGSHIEYYREIKLEESILDIKQNEDYEVGDLWQPKYELHNCIPTKTLQKYFSEVGSVLLMSATIQPFNPFRKATAINKCISHEEISNKKEVKEVLQEEDGSLPEQKSRNVEEVNYPLKFPKENRLSLTLKPTKYTTKNKKTPTLNENKMSRTRKEYAELIKLIATSHGNILIGMPSYNEAKWAKEILEKHDVDSQKEIVLDQSSSSKETDQTLKKFFGEKESIIVTSIRGTITEGVDYSGEKLHTAAVIGVPLLPRTEKRKAIEFAYDNILETDNLDGREMVDRIPAVRKTRQTFGRVIRGETDIGTRILIDKRYGYPGRSGVQHLLSNNEIKEFTTIDGNKKRIKEKLDEELSNFWKEHKNT